MHSLTHLTTTPPFSIAKFVVVATVMSSLLSTAILRADERPNFAFILTDDQSYGMMGCDGNSQIQTPNLDALAKEGVFFDRAYVTSAICTPSRISILLSQFERRHGVNFNSGTSVAPDAWNKSYPVILRQAGYYTGYVGKNHAPIGDGGYSSGLMEESFDYFYAGHGHLRFYPKDAHAIFKQATSDTQVEIIQEGVNDFLSNEHRLDGAIRFLDSRPANQPFCLSICFNLPHSAGTSSMQQRDGDDEIYKSLYRDQEISLPTGYIAKKDIVTPKLPASVLNVAERQASYDFVDTPQDCRERLIRQMQAMTGIDRLVGRLRMKLAEHSLSENTVIVFSSDHGLFMGEHGLGGKALCYEKVTHVPMIIFDPTAPPSTRQRRSDALVQSIDIAPTLLDYAGIDSPETFQGHSLKGLVQGDRQPVRDYIFTENLWSTHFGNPRIESVQNKEWKYIRYYQNNNLPASFKRQVSKELDLGANKTVYGISDAEIPIYRYYIESSLRGEAPVYEELYHLSEDPLENHNLIEDDSARKVLGELKAAWQRELTKARGTGPAKVLRYTTQSKLEHQLRELKASKKKRSED